MQYDFSIPQGTDVRRIISLKSQCSRQAIDLTGARVRMQLRRSSYSKEAIDTIDSAVDKKRCWIDEESGLVYLVWPNKLTSSLPSGRFFYDLEIESAGGEVSRVLEGQVTVTPEVTRV